MNIKIAQLFLCLCLIGSVMAAEKSPYAGQETRTIKALSESQQQDLLAGKGMGLALAAELNGYPGPLHVLEFADELEITPEQRLQTESLFQAMKTSAQDLGSKVIEAERALDELFASAEITPASLETAVARIGKLRAELRAVHLQAHLEQTQILSDQQTAQYQELRGYMLSHHEHHHMSSHHEDSE